MRLSVAGESYLRIWVTVATVVMCCIDLEIDAFPGCIHSEVGIKSKA